MLYEFAKSSKRETVSYENDDDITYVAMFAHRLGRHETTEQCGWHSSSVNDDAPRARCSQWSVVSSFQKALAKVKPRIGWDCLKANRTLINEQTVTKGDCKTTPGLCLNRNWVDAWFTVCVIEFLMTACAALGGAMFPLSGVGPCRANKRYKSFVYRYRWTKCCAAPLD